MSCWILSKPREISLTSAQERELYACQLALGAKIAQYQNCLFAAGSGMEPAAHCPSLEIRKTAGTDEQLDAEIAKRAPRLVQLARSEPASLSTLKATLGADGSELVAYLSLDSQLLIRHVSPTTLTVRSVFLPGSELKRKVATLRATLIDPARPYDQTVAHQLY